MKLHVDLCCWKRAVLYWLLCLLLFQKFYCRIWCPLQLVHLYCMKGICVCTSHCFSLTILQSWRMLLVLQCLGKITEPKSSLDSWTFFWELNDGILFQTEREKRPFCPLKAATAQIWRDPTGEGTEIVPLVSYLNAELLMLTRDLLSQNCPHVCPEGECQRKRASRYQLVALPDRA